MSERRRLNAVGVRRSLVVVAGLALFVAACGNTAGSTPPTNAPVVGDGPAPTTEASATTPAPDPTTAATGARPQGPAAPDFELALAKGGTFTLSAEQKPVYMVFWAEW